mmetsp:Transcript_21982/g.61790  ORF Transcript_21982/g.61790 Transcript_21982/m.61790 type:complete len:244 (-) Transcript_21982:3330-4061(-)
MSNATSAPRWNTREEIVKPSMSRTPPSSPEPTSLAFPERSTRRRSSFFWRHAFQATAPPGPSAFSARFTVWTDRLEARPSASCAAPASVMRLPCSSRVLIAGLAATSSRMEATASSPILLPPNCTTEMLRWCLQRASANARTPSLVSTLFVRLMVWMLGLTSRMCASSSMTESSTMLSLRSSSRRLLFCMQSAFRMAGTDGPSLLPDRRSTRRSVTLSKALHSFSISSSRTLAFWSESVRTSS